MKLNKYLS